MKTVLTILVVAVLLIGCGKQEAAKKTVSPLTPSTSLSVADSCSGKSPAEVFQSSDGCNVCSCNAEGVMRCTQIACQVP